MLSGDLVRNVLLAGLCLTCLSGCWDEVVGREIVSKSTEDRSVSCNYAGMCADCGIDFSGSFSCGSLKYKAGCSGRQIAVSEVTRTRVLYKSGEKKIIEDVKAIKPLTSCK